MFLPPNFSTDDLPYKGKMIYDIQHVFIQRKRKKLNQDTKLVSSYC